MRYKNNQGFTLIELLAVIAIIGVLSSLIMVSMGGSRSMARDSRRATDLRQIISAQESVMNDNNLYYTHTESVGEIPAIKNAADFQYIGPLTDPLDRLQYRYIWVDNTEACPALGLIEGKFYCAIARLELKGKCAANENHYFIANQKSQREICSSDDYSSIRPSCAVCAGW